MHLSRITVLSGLVFLMFVTVNTAKADPLVFSNVVALQGNSTRVDLFSNPGTLLVGPQISFLVDVSGVLPTGGTDTLQITFAEAGQLPVIQTFRIPLFDGLSLPYSQLFSFTFQNPTFQGTPATLRVDILGSSPDFIIPTGPDAGQRVDAYTYDIKGVQPVPEPGTMALMAMGVAALWGKIRYGRGKAEMNE
jgi:PEP-CTERM motif